MQQKAKNTQDKWTSKNGKPRVFAKSKVDCLLLHRGGQYYASAKVGGKIIRRALDTTDFNTANNRLAGVLAEMRGATNTREALTLGESVTKESMREDPEIKTATRHYYQQISKALAKVAASHPDNIFARSITKVTLADLRDLMDAYAATASPTRYNGALALLRRTYERAIEAGHVAINHPLKLGRSKPKKRMHNLPTAAAFASIVQDILAQKKTHSKATAAAVELLAYTGLRISEAQALKWQDIKSDQLVARNAKNDDIRTVPLIPAAKSLLSRLKATGIPTGANDPVMLIKSPRIALAGACDRLGIDHMRVHDLRHIFATRCIEGGVDLPTLAAWLGHKDGGVLAAQVYGHLCEKHSNAMAQKVMA